MNYLFPIAFFSNTIAMTAFFVVLGLAGKSGMAAEVGIVHGATLALFYTFSANARNVILDSSSTISVTSLVRIRTILAIPLGIAAFYLSVYLAGVEGVLASVLILRRCGEWIGELHLSEREVYTDRGFATRFAVIQLILLLLALGWLFGGAPVPMAGVFLWASVPLLLSWRFIQNHLRSTLRFLNNEGWAEIIPHFGSTAIMGITIYVFRLLILLFAGKETAGDLYTAFAIGGFVGSAFANTLGPSLVFEEGQRGKQRLPRFLTVSLGIWFLTGIAVFLFTWITADTVGAIGKSDLFWGATGLSMIGGVIMVFAQRARLRVLQKYKEDRVFGPDLIVHILIVTSVPYIYYLLGIYSLISLYLVNSALALLFYTSLQGGTTLVTRDRRPSREQFGVLISLLLFVPVFFQLTGTIFRDPTFIFDSQGALMRVPLPLSILACFVGILFLGGYGRAYLALWMVFGSFVLMLISCMVSTAGQLSGQGAKIILLLQFVVPMFGLVLGQMYGSRENDKSLEKMFVGVLVVLVPLQLLATWLQGYVVLSPYLYVFSVYQHLQYVPVMFVAGYLIALYSVWDLRPWKDLLIILSPLMGIYASASSSMLAMGLLVGGLTVFMVYRQRHGLERALKITVFLVVATSVGYVGVATNISHSVIAKSTSYILRDKFPFLRLVNGSGDVHQKEVINIFPTIKARFAYWDHYAREIVSRWNTFVYGHAAPPDRLKYPSAHNYYLDFVYNFGFLGMIPLLGLIGYTLYMVYRTRPVILEAPRIFGLTLVVLFLILGDNSFKVGLRQPYPGIFTYFLWGVLLSELLRLSQRTKAVGQLWLRSG